MLVYVPVNSGNTEKTHCGHFYLRKNANCFQIFSQQDLAIFLAETAEVR